ncbi:hypothetical protein N7488_006814 [Penicillium malachiteum]|nr:hypothetical protein N7488_006814 [Penicillium malachiteum]
MVTRIAAMMKAQEEKDKVLHGEKRDMAKQLKAIKVTNIAAPLSSSQLLSQALPGLSITDNRTTSSALHNMHWTIATAHASLMDTEYFSVADEHSSRFCQNVGQVVSAVASEENQGFSFSDSKAAEQP